jgi:glutamyl-tRNA reductase
MHHLVSRSVGKFRVLNRTPEHARELAGRFKGTSSGLETLSNSLRWADVLVCAAGAEEPIVGVKALKSALKARRGRPIVAIDIAVPRAVDPAADRLDNLYRYDMDTLSEVTRDALRHRRKEFIQCCTLIDAAALRMAADSRAHDAGGAIAELERAFREVAEMELGDLEKRLPELGELERNRVRRAVHRIVRKLLHMPVQALRESDPEVSDVLLRAFTTGKKRNGE